MNTPELARFSEVVGLVYEGATDPSRWTKDILPTLTEYIQAPKCVLYTPFLMPQNGGFAYIQGVSQQQIELYATRYQSEDMHGQVAVAKGLVFEGSVLLDSDLFPREQLLASSYYKDYLSREDMVQLMTTVVFGPDSQSHLSVVVCSFWRGLADQAYDEQDRAKLKLLMPHLSRSLGVMQRLRCAELTVATTLAALDRLSSGVLLIDVHGDVTFANRQAQRLLGYEDGLRLQKLTNKPGLGQLIADNDNANLAITQAISAILNRDIYTTAHFSQSVAVPQNTGSDRYTLQFSELGNHHEYNTGNEAPAAIIFITDSRQQINVSPEVLQNAYRLTPAEARVAIALLESASTQDAAAQLDINISTVRTHIKQIYVKLGVDSRARFVRLMLGLASSGT